MQMEEIGKVSGGAMDKSQATTSVIFENKQDAQKERGRERGFLHARKEHAHMWHMHTQKEKDNRWKFCCTWRRRARIHG